MKKSENLKIVLFYGLWLLRWQCCCDSVDAPRHLENTDAIPQDANKGPNQASAAVQEGTPIAKNSKIEKDTSNLPNKFSEVRPKEIFNKGEVPEEVSKQPESLNKLENNLNSESFEANQNKINDVAETDIFLLKQKEILTHRSKEATSPGDTQNKVNSIDFPSGNIPASLLSKDDVKGKESIPANTNDVPKSQSTANIRKDPDKVYYPPAQDYLDQGASTTEELLSQQQPSDSEVMPSFDEWKKMMLAEQEKDGHKIPSPGIPGKKIANHKRRRNYASYECGAKIVGSNLEAESTSRILNELVDEYMLNPCKAKIWFVIELCETIQTSVIEIANFELFSSAPKEFALYWSDRYPTREWTPLGTFTAQDQRVLQTFPVQQNGFGKFIKVELLSHYGTEHYCPLSVIRAFGASMVDEYEEMERPESIHPASDDEDDRLDTGHESIVSKDLFGSATEAVISIVKKAAQVLGRDSKEGEREKDSQVKKDGSVPSCDSLFPGDQKNCIVTNKTNKSAADSFLPTSLPLQYSLTPYLEHCGLCSAFPLVDDWQSHAEPALTCRFLQAALGPVVFDSVCRFYKGDELPLSGKRNASQQSIHPSLTKSKIEVSEDQKTVILSSPYVTGTGLPLQSSIVSSEKLSLSSAELPKEISSSSSIETGTISPSSESGDLYSDSSQSSQAAKVSQNEIPWEISSSEKKCDSSDLASSSSTDISNMIAPTKTEHKPSLQSNDTEENRVVELTVSPNVLESALEIKPSVTESKLKATELPVSQESSVPSSGSADASDQSLGLEDSMTLSIVSTTPHFFEEEFEEGKNGESKIEQTMQTLKTESTLFGGVTSSSQKESVFMRMGNRIKALELNMSLSSQYLQELSQRYRKQMEEMQKAFNRTINALNDTAKKAAERDIRQQDTIGQLQNQLVNLTQAVDLLLNERSTVHRQMIETHVCLMFIEAIVMITILSLCVRRMNSQLNLIGMAGNETFSPRTVIKRRNSVNGHIQPTIKKVKKRSSSEENVTSSQDVLIIEQAVPIMVEPPPKVKKKHRNRKQRKVHRSISNPSLCSSQCANSSLEKPTDKEQCVSSAGVLFSHDDLQKSKSSLVHTLSEESINPMCENCVQTKCTTSANAFKSVKNIERERRLPPVPLQNLTNGVLCNGVSAQQKKSNEKEAFSLKKFLRLQKRDSV